MKSDVEIAWAVGLFEGEGCITISHQTQKNREEKYKQPRLKLSMVDSDIVERFFSIVELGQTCKQTFKNPEYKTQLCWYTGKRSDVVTILELFLPYLGERRKARAIEVLEVCNYSKVEN